MLYLANCTRSCMAIADTSFQSFTYTLHLTNCAQSCVASETPYGLSGTNQLTARRQAITSPANRIIICTRGKSSLMLYVFTLLG